ncbi:MAG: hypothetical protein HY513_05205 [Candidatus Aenigmarchaeota archaeon]|nr:hypothetical protein [Candidatus Aenigmarchaeota archaeon]
MADGTIKPIKDVDLKDFVSINFKNLKVEKCLSHAKFVNREISEVYEIDTGYKIKASPTHRFFKVDNFEIKESEAQNIQQGDWLLHISSMNFEGTEQELPEIELEEMITISPKGAEILRKAIREKSFTRKTICAHLPITARQLRRVLNQNYPTNVKTVGVLKTMQVIDDDFDDYIEPFISHKHRNVIMPNTLNAELAQMFGYFLGDGNLEKTSVRFTDQRREVLEKYSEISRNLFGLDGYVSKVKDKNAWRLNINSIVVRRLFSELKSKYMEYISRSPNNIVAALIRGFADAEGYVSKKKGHICIAQKDEQILKYIQMLLLRFDIRSSLRKGRRTTHMYMEGRDMVAFHKKIGLSATDKSSLLEIWSEHYENTFTRELLPINRHEIWNMLKEVGLMPSSYMKSRPNSYKMIHKKDLKKAVDALLKTKLAADKRVKFMEALINGDVMLEKVKRIIKMPNTEPLYDISIPANENYIANGFVVHNSGFRLYLRKSKQTKRIARLIDSISLPEGEAVFNVTEKGIED